jgi:hypothetical protein
MCLLSPSSGRGVNRVRGTGNQSDKAEPGRTGGEEGEDQARSRETMGEGRTTSRAAYSSP